MTRPPSPAPRAIRPPAHARPSRPTPPIWDTHPPTPASAASPARCGHTDRAVTLAIVAAGWLLALVAIALAALALTS